MLLLPLWIRLALAVSILPSTAIAQNGARARFTCAEYFATPAPALARGVAPQSRPLVETLSPYESAALDLFRSIEAMGEQAARALSASGGRTRPGGSAIETAIQAYREAAPVLMGLRQNAELEHSANDPDLTPLIETERLELRAQLASTLHRWRGPLASALTPTGDVAILDVGRSDAGGFGAEDIAALISMYSRYAASKSWRVSILEESLVNSELRRAVLKIEGTGAYQALHLDRGDHRFIRHGDSAYARATGGRFTRYARVTVYRPPRPSEFQLNSDDLEVTTMRSSGAGGQHVNRTESAVRIVHRPTGLAVRVENERSQHQNRAIAIELITVQLFARFQAERERAQRAERQQGRVNAQVISDQGRWTRTYDWTMNSDAANRAISGDLDPLLAPRLDTALVEGLRRFTQGLERGSIDVP